MKKMFFLILSIALITLNSYGQSNLKPDSLMLAAMGKVYFMTGKWSGSGWIQMGRERHSFVQSENVLQKVNGTVIVIDGLGIDAETGQKVHEAFAVISFDLANQKYMMRAFRADGNYIDADVTIDENGCFKWGFTHPQAGQIRYFSCMVDGKWSEKGEMCRDGKNWYPFFEMNLSKVE